MFSCLVVKDLLAHTIYSAFGRNISWFKNTYDMETQLLEFVDHYWDLKTDQKDHSFIIKPWFVPFFSDIFTDPRTFQGI